MADIFEKVDNSTLKRTMQETREVVYDYDFLLARRASLLKETAENEALIAQAQAFGLKSQVTAIDAMPVTVDPAIDPQVK